jgi:hypothetical protein
VTKAFGKVYQYVDYHPEKGHDWSTKSKAEEDKKEDAVNDSDDAAPASATSESMKLLQDYSYSCCSGGRNSQMDARVSGVLSGGRSHFKRSFEYKRPRSGYFVVNCILIVNKLYLSLVFLTTDIQRLF